MKYDLAKPCDECPFRSDKKFYLDSRKVTEIVDGLLYYNTGFSCHKTTTCKDRTAQHRNAQNCAGALIFLEKNNASTNTTRISERIGLYDRSKLDMDSPVYETKQEMIVGCSDI